MIRCYTEIEEAVRINAREIFTEDNPLIVHHEAILRIKKERPDLISELDNALSQKIIVVI